MALEKPINEITDKDLQDLIDNEVPESRTLDYKEGIPTTSDEAKEFKGDVVSFANSAGGHLIYGVREAAGVPIELCGIDLPDPDAKMLQLENMLRDSIQPRVQRVAMKAVKLVNGKCCMVIHIPRSLLQPHAVAQSKALAFYARNSAGKYPLDVPELRSAFLHSESIAERMRQFRAQRLGTILGNEAPVPLTSGPLVIYHLLPLTAFDSANTININISNNGNHLRDLYNWGTNQRYNIDGLLAHNWSQPPQPGFAADKYLQLYRTGILEAVDGYGLSGVGTNIAGDRYEDRIIEHVTGFLDTMTVLGADRPVFLMITMCRVAGYEMFIGDNNMGRYRGKPMDREIIMLPDVEINSFSVEPKELLRPIFDAFWNSAGWERSPSYNADGTWTRTARYNNY